MSENERKILENAEINVDEGINRFLDDEELYLEFLGKFLEDDSMDKLKQSVAEKNIEKSFMAAHTLKGVSANLSISGINKILNPMVEVLRVGGFDGIPEELDKLTIVYENVMKAINSVVSE